MASLSTTRTRVFRCFFAVRTSIVEAHRRHNRRFSESQACLNQLLTRVFLESVVSAKDVAEREISRYVRTTSKMMVSCTIWSRIFSPSGPTKAGSLYLNFHFTQSGL